MSGATQNNGEFSREVRLGLVLYGGVSLAIYMNGTTNELFRAVRGRGVYFIVKHLLDADITVDVASGASAGGINGIFLAFALANEREFGTCADLWRRDGDLGSLLSKLEGDTVPSVLDSAHYRDVLENGFRVMWENQARPNEPEVPSETRELDLFVTGTDFYGRHAQSVDSTGHVIETKQHRTLFLLKHRQRSDSKCQLDPRRDPYGKWENRAPVKPQRGAAVAELEEPKEPAPPDGGLRALAKLAQLTSCFPGAFAAVHVASEPASRGNVASDADRKLTVWGQLQQGEHYFVDGGVLDNKPFTSTLDTIFHRPAHRRVCRHVLYLEPDPERFSAEAGGKLDSDGKLCAPSFLSSVIDSVTRLPSYESIAGDLASITEHNASIQRFDELVQGLSDTENPAASTATYETARLLAIGRRVIAELAEALASIEFSAPGAGAGVKAKLSTELIEELLRKLKLAIQDVPRAERAQRLKRVDVDFYVRRLLAFTYVLEEQCERTDFRELWKHVNEEIQRLEIVRSAMERVVVPPRIWAGGDGFDAHVTAIEGKDLWMEISRRTLALLDYAAVEDWMPEEPAYPQPSATPEGRREILASKEYRRAKFRETLEARLRVVQELPLEKLPKAEPKRTLLEVSDQRLGALIRNSSCDVQEFMSTFERDDALRFPLELAARVHQRDQMSVVRLSPFDAQTGLSKRSLEDKICGETFGHFGAFLKKSWRSNDILWGRLDGICRLVETLLLHTRFGTPGGKRPDPPSPNVPHLLRALDQLGPGGRREALGSLFPNLEARIHAPGARTQSRNPDPLDRLLGVFEEQAPPSLAYGQRLSELLIEVAQLDALCEDLPKVVGDAAEEQLAWGQCKAGGKVPSPRTEGASASPVSFWAEAWEFRANGVALDASVLNLATRAFADQALAGMDLVQLYTYFQQTYAVGSESASLAMPSTVIADLGARTAVLAEHALVGSGQLGKTLRENGLYRLIVRYPLRVIGAFASFLRRSPQFTQAIVVGSLLYAALAIVVNVLFARALYEKQGLERGVAIWAFGILPFSALVGSWVIWRAPMAKRVLVAVVAIAAVVSVWIFWSDIVGALQGAVCKILCKAH